MAKAKYENRLKTAIQAVFIAAIVILLLIPLFKTDFITDFESYCPFGGIMTLGSKAWLGSMSCQMSETQIFMGLALIVGVILFGKLFCGYICPIGTVIEWLQKLAVKLKLKIITLRGWPDRILRVFKYAILYFTAYYSITSSELFCKKFDPYYVSVTGFGHDVVFWWGLAAILFVLGSVFIRFFWCKYLCPLAALSNIAANILVSAPILIVYLIIRWAGLDLHVAWLLAALSLAGAATEIFRFKFYDLNPFKITVVEPTCSHCDLCDMKCPQGIEVNHYEQVDHPDCTLCMDCVKTCPKPGAIRLWKWNKTWIPPVIILLFIALALLFAGRVEFTTITERWGGFDSLQTVQSMEISNLRSVKCFGSATSLQRKLMRNRGIVGIDAYAKNHHVRIFYNTEILDSTGVKKAVFSPSKYKIRDPKSDISTISVIRIGVEELFDGYDNNDLFYLLMASPDVFAFRTEFGEPVMVDIYYNGLAISPEGLRGLIDAGGYDKPVKDDKTERVETPFRSEKHFESLPDMTLREFIMAFFPAKDQTFNNYKNYDAEDLFIFEFGMPQAENSRMGQQINYFVSHLSEYNGIVRFRTDFTDRAVGQVYFLPDSVDSMMIVGKMTAPEMKVYLRDGSTTNFKNPFKMEEPFRIYQNKTK